MEQYLKPETVITAVLPETLCNISAGFPDTDWVTETEWE